VNRCSNEHRSSAGRGDPYRAGWPHSDQPATRKPKLKGVNDKRNTTKPESRSSTIAAFFKNVNFRVFRRE
jgi:hypothetical protein